jgi:putative flippase GtrA
VINSFLSRQFVGFLGVGVTAAVLHWLARLFLSFWLVFPVAVGLAYGVGLATAFVLNRRFVFPNSSRPMGDQVRSFVSVNLLFFPVVWGCALLLNTYVLPFTGMERHTEEVAHAIAIAVPMLATFLIYKYSTFRGA